MKRVTRKFLSMSIAVSMLFSLANPAYVRAENIYAVGEVTALKEYEWVQDSYGWKYACNEDDYVKSQFMVISGQTYYFKGDGYMATGWMLIDNRWYYFNEYGHMSKGWIVVDNKSYYMYEDGHMASNEYVNGYYLNASGVWTYDEWVKDSNGWWLKLKEGGYAVGWKQVDGSWYWFNSSGYMVTGWQYISGSWYYFNTSGRMEIGWLYNGGSWYYMDISGHMVTGWYVIDGSWYYFDGSGHMVTGWLELSGNWYYLNGSGQMMTNWQYISGNWYFFDESGRMLQGEGFVDNGTFYFFDNSGVWVPDAWPVEGEPGYFYITVGTFQDEVTLYLIDMLNEYRASNGVAPLEVDEELMECAAVRAAECSVEFSHDRPNGQPCFSLSDNMAGENIAARTYYGTAYDMAGYIMDMWKNSSGHNENMLRDYYSTVGISAFLSDGVIYCVQNFGI